MKYLKTKKATNWPMEKSWKEKLISGILFFIPKSNPDYKNKMYLVKSWLIEFLETDGELSPWREIALDENENPVFAGPDERNYGFWCDTNMKFEDFNGKPIDKNEFERLWEKSGVKALEI
ncbi:hypothetical protein [Psychroserpens algicola]|uniref:Uncharacterized protein n=1 Tax=Psychroserpens algicola TaxID=1719034 RepID=A0ABT0HER8_9FLAO|nr:hypothetical protein [Psychroserpens algicola]MCK8482317.1 hypothetical protein [Psychroserpens algicola]